MAFKRWESLGGVCKATKALRCGYAARVDELARELPAETVTFSGYLSQYHRATGGKNIDGSWPALETKFPSQLNASLASMKK